MTTEIDDLVKRLDDYFAMGGLYNPELANHQAVSELLKDCRTAILAMRERIAELEGALKAIKHEKYCPKRHTATIVG